MRFSEEKTGLDDKTLDQVIGKGVRFPDIFSDRTGGCAIREGVEKINQAISDILMTRKGERPLRPNYGSKIHQLLFDPLDEITLDMMRIYIEEALEEWEPRIIVQRIDLSIPEDERHTVDVEIQYRIKNTNLQEVYTKRFNPEGRGFVE